MSALFSFVVSFSIVGYNYSVQYKASTLIFTLGYSHTNAVKVPQGVLVKTTNKRTLHLYGANRLLLTHFVSKLSKLKKPNIFTGKGLILDSKHFKVKKRG
jgi:large subunit ribosomal protein L6